MKRTVVLAHDAHSAKQARRFMAEHLDGYAPHIIDSATLLASELVTNSIRHATGSVTLTVDITDDVLRVHVYDDGPASPVVRSPAPTEPTGRGLRIVAELADDWGVEERPGGGNEVWFCIELEKGRLQRSARQSTTRRGAAGQRAFDWRSTRSVLRSTTVRPAGFAPTRRCQLSRSVPST